MLVDQLIMTNVMLLVGFRVVGIVRGEHADARYYGVFWSGVRLDDGKRCWDK